MDTHGKSEGKGEIYIKCQMKERQSETVAACTIKNSTVHAVVEIHFSESLQIKLIHFCYACSQVIHSLK